MKKYLIPLLVGAVLILLAGATYYFVVQLPQKSIAALELEKARLVSQTSQEEHNKQAQLDKCLEEAKERARSSFELNSYPAPQEGYLDARRWDSDEIKVQTEDKYNDDRDFCLKLYK